jgi:hypothetical protein
MKLVTLLVQSDSSRFARRENRGSNKATEGRRFAGRKNSELWSQKDIDEELAEIKADIDKLELWMWQDKKMVQVCEPKTGKFLGEENELGSAGDLKNCQEGKEEEIPNYQVGNEIRSLRDLIDCHEDSQGISHCQLGNEMRSLRDLTDC